MILKSPTASQFGEAVGSRLPKQIKRALPIYIAIIVLLLFFSYSDIGASATNGANINVFKRKSEHQSTPKRERIVYTPSLNRGTKFPKKIWQSWKIDPLGFDERDSNTARTWTQKNPDHRYEVLTDSNDQYYVESHFGPTGLNRMDIVEMYKTLTVKIVKADLLRYLVMYIEGGVYADIDVEALRPIKRFIPERYDEADIDMVISVEIDQPAFRDHPYLGSKSYSFCQWTFMCKPRLPVMLRLIDNVMNWLNEVAARQNVPVSEITLDFDEVISGTGPTAFTIAVLQEMSVVENRDIDWMEFHAMSESKLVGGVLVLTVEAFAAGQGHSDSGNHDARTALVKHHYHASGWPTVHPRYRHPVYAEVELCNWDPECVEKWDQNVAAFEALSPKEQQKVIEFKEAADRELETFLELEALRQENERLNGGNEELFVEEQADFDEPFEKPARAPAKAAPRSGRTRPAAEPRSASMRRPSGGVLQAAAEQIAAHAKPNSAKPAANPPVKDYGPGAPKPQPVGKKGKIAKSPVALKPKTFTKDKKVAGAGDAAKAATAPQPDVVIKDEKVAMAPKISVTKAPPASAMLAAPEIPDTVVNAADAADAHAPGQLIMENP